MDFLIKPYESAGPISLGMTKEQVRSAMHENQMTSMIFGEQNLIFLLILLYLLITQKKMDFAKLLSFVNQPMLYSMECH